MTHYLQKYHAKLFFLCLLVQLVQGHKRIEKSDLKSAITIGRLSSENLHLMVNKIMESIYIRVFKLINVNRNGPSGKETEKHVNNTG